MGWFKKYSGLFLIMVGELAAILGLTTYFLASKVAETRPNGVFDYVLWVIRQASEIGDFLSKLDAYQYYALGGGVFGIVILLAGLVLVIRALQKAGI